MYLYIGLKYKNHTRQYLKRFYADLYSSNSAEPARTATDQRAVLTKHHTEDVPSISLYKMKIALKGIKIKQRRSKWNCDRISKAGRTENNCIPRKTG